MKEMCKHFYSAVDVGERFHVKHGLSAGTLQLANYERERPNLTITAL